MVTGSPGAAFFGVALASILNLPIAPEKFSGFPSFGTGTTSKVTGFVSILTSRLLVNIPGGSAPPNC